MPLAPAPSREPRQRWRLTFARRVSSDEPAAIGRAYATLWESALLASGLPVVIADSGRPRFALAAQLPAGASGRAELADTWLTERWPAWRVREALVPVLDPSLQSRLEEVLHLNLTDDRLAWTLGPDGRWERPPAEGVRNVQSRLAELALDRVGRRERPA